MFRSLAFVFTVLLLSARLTAEQKRLSFPGVEEAAAPTGPFVLRYIKPASSESEHEVRIVDRSKGSSCWSYRFLRQVDALWSSDGGAVALTDWTGSNLADLIVVFPTQKCRAVSIPDALVRSLGKSVLPKDSNHMYYEATSWRTPTVLEFKVWGDSGSISPLGKFEPLPEVRKGNADR